MRPRTSSLPTVSDAQLAFQSARRHPARRLAAYTVLATFIGMFLILSFGNGNTKAWEELEVGTVKGRYQLLYSHLLILWGFASI